MMKTFVFAHDRADSMTTPLMLEADGVEHTVLVSGASRAEALLRGGRVNPERLELTGHPVGLGNSRNGALERMAEGEWAMFLVDDMKQCYELDTYESEPNERLPISFENQGEYRTRFRTPISTAQLIHRAQALIPKLESRNINLMGFTAYENPMFRAKKWGYQVLADGRAWLLRKTHLRFDPNVNFMDDYGFTAQNIAELGGVAVNRWILPDFVRWGNGGLGTIEERMAGKITEAQYLVDKYPGLLMFKKKKGWPERSHIALRSGLNKKYPVKEID
jgi:hypothetical protein